VWLWRWPEGYREARATFWSALARMDECDDFVFTCNQVVLLSWVEEGDPDLFDAIKKRVADGRWVLTGGRPPQCWSHFPTVGRRPGRHSAVFPK
jgi:alpha-mannosidase